MEGCLLVADASLVEHAGAPHVPPMLVTTIPWAILVGPWVHTGVWHAHALQCGYNHNISSTLHDELGGWLRAIAQVIISLETSLQVRSAACQAYRLGTYLVHQETLDQRCRVRKRSYTIDILVL